jgi:hypothetical protein
MSVLASVIALAAATLLHHVHNAAFLHDYPSMPDWISPLGVYAAWFAATTIGLTGYALLRRGRRIAGYALLIAYGCYGLDGLTHYALAPMAAHTASMNLTIWIEAFAGAALLLACLVTRNRPSP